MGTLSGTDSGTDLRTEARTATIAESIALDAEVELKVVSTLKSARDLDAFAIGVRSSDRVVTLTGTVGTYAERVGAEEITAGCEGVGRVDNSLVVRAYGTDWTVTDDELVERIRATLRVLAPDTDVSDLRFSVKFRVVRLHGRVATVADRACVRHAIESLPGVDFVTNYIEANE